jgi:hypothetical protein
MHYGDDDEDEDGTFSMNNDEYAVASAIATAAADYADARKRADLLTAYAASLTPSRSTANATTDTAAAAAASSVSAADTATITGTTAAAAAPPTTPECAVKRQQRVFPRLRDPNITRLANARYLATRDACRVDPVRF